LEYLQCFTLKNFLIQHIILLDGQ